MDLPAYYPLNDFGPVMKGMVIGGMGIVHVFLAQFAVGGGLVLLWFEHLAQSGREPAARRFVDGYFRALVLISFVAGALTGVGMWLTAIQVSPRTIGLMVDTFHWVWATEWLFFALEIVTGYAFYRYGARLTGRTRLRLLGLYSIAAWGSLFWINGILSWQLTPGSWTSAGSLWSGLFNPSFWPSVVFRTIVCLTIASLVACVVTGLMKDVGAVDRRRLIRRAAFGLVPMAAMPFVGAWFLAVVPADSRSWVLGGSAAMTLFLGIAVGASTLIGAYAGIGILRRGLTMNAATSSLLLALAFGATAGGEFVREGIRKPFTVRRTLYANSVTPAEVATLRRVGAVTFDPYPLRDADDVPTDELRRGARVFRLLCSTCHTVDGANGVTHLAGPWSRDQRFMNLAKLQWTKPFMPPFAGNADDVYAIADWIAWRHAGSPAVWDHPAERSTDRAVGLAKIRAWLDEAGVERAP